MPVFIPSLQEKESKKEEIKYYVSNYNQPANPDEVLGDSPQAAFPP